MTDTTNLKYIQCNIENEKGEVLIGVDMEEDQPSSYEAQWVEKKNVLKDNDSIWRIALGEGIPANSNKYLILFCQNCKEISPHHQCKQVNQNNRNKYKCYAFTTTRGDGLLQHFTKTYKKAGFQSQELFSFKEVPPGNIYDDTDSPDIDIIAMARQSIPS